MQITANIDIVHATNDITMLPVLSNIVPFLKNIPIPIVDPTTINMTERKPNLFLSLTILLNYF
jgi:hypothetical protein